MPRGLPSASLNKSEKGRGEFTLQQATAKLKNKLRKKAQARIIMKQVYRRSFEWKNKKEKSLCCSLLTLV